MKTHCLYATVGILLCSTRAWAVPAAIGVHFRTDRSSSGSGVLVKAPASFSSLVTSRLVVLTAAHVVAPAGARTPYEASLRFPACPKTSADEATPAKTVTAKVGAIQCLGDIAFIGLAKDPGVPCARAVDTLASGGVPLENLQLSFFSIDPTKGLLKAGTSDFRADGAWDWPITCANVSLASCVIKPFGPEGGGTDLFRLPLSGQGGYSGGGVFVQANGTDILAGLVIARDSSFRPIVVHADSIKWPTAMNGSYKSCVRELPQKALLSLETKSQWRFRDLKSPCPDVYAALEALEALEVRSDEASRDDSSVPDVDPQQMSILQTLVDVLVAKSAGGLTVQRPLDSTCGGWRTEVAGLVKIYVEVKAWQRRIGAYQTAWSAFHRGVVASDATSTPRWGVFAGKPCNPVETAIVAACRSGAGTAKGQVESAAATTSPLVACVEAPSTFAPAKLWSALWSSRLVREEEASDDAKGHVQELLSGLTSWAALASPEDETSRAQRAAFWGGMLRYSLLDGAKLLQFAGGAAESVLQTREAILANPVSAGFTTSLDAIEKEIQRAAPAASYTGHVHVALTASKSDALSPAADVDAHLTGPTAPVKLHAARTLSELLRMFATESVGSHKLLEDGFGQPRATTAFAVWCDAAHEKLEALEGHVAEALLELLEEKTPPPFAISSAPLSPASPTSTASVPPGPTTSATPTAPPP